MAKTKVIQAAIIIAIVEKVASFSPYSIALFVPTSCAPIQRANPRATGDLIENRLRLEGPITPLKIPVIITKTVVKGGRPPISFDTSIAIGVVIDRGKILINTSD